MNIQNLIIGSGIAALSCAYELDRQDQDFLILEKSSCPGGNWASCAYKNSLYEFGPNSFMSNAPELLEMVKAIGFENNLLNKSFKDSKRYLYLDNKLIPVKPGPGLLFSGLLNPLDILRALFEIFIPANKSKREETIDEFFTRRFGKGIAKRLVANALQGIWAGDTTKLSMQATMLALYKKEQEHDSILKSFIFGKKIKKSPLTTYSFKGGMQSFCHKMVEYLGLQNFKFDVEINSVRRSGTNYETKLADGATIKSDSLVLATKAFEAATLVQDFAPRLAELLNKIYYAPIALCAYTLPKSFFSKQAQECMDAFGFISGDPEHISLGTIWSSQLFPERNLQDEYLMLSFAGGSRHPEILDSDQERLWLQIVHEQREVLQALSNKTLTVDDFTKINCKIIPQAIPQYHLGHLQLIDEIKAELAQYPGLNLIGNYLSGVSIADTVRYSLSLTEQIAKASAIMH